MCAPYKVYYRRRAQPSCHTSYQTRGDISENVKLPIFEQLGVEDSSQKGKLVTELGLRPITVEQVEKQPD